MKFVKDSPVLLIPLSVQLYAASSHSQLIVSDQGLSKTVDPLSDRIETTACLTSTLGDNHALSFITTAPIMLWGFV